MPLLNDITYQRSALFSPGLLSLKPFPQQQRTLDISLFGKTHRCDGTHASLKFASAVPQLGENKAAYITNPGNGFVNIGIMYFLSHQFYELDQLFFADVDEKIGGKKLDKAGIPGAGHGILPVRQGGLQGWSRMFEIKILLNNTLVGRRRNHRNDAEGGCSPFGSTVTRCLFLLRKELLVDQISSYHCLSTSIQKTMSVLISEHLD